MNKRGKNKQGQVWIETVIYTMIAFVMIGLVLSYAKPAIEEKQDKTLLEQSTVLMKEIDSVILRMGSVGNSRTFYVTIKKGQFKINSTTDSLIFEMESKSIYTEPDIPVNDGNVIILTTKKTDYHLVRLMLNYSDTYNITYNEGEENKLISKSPTSYNLKITKIGGTPDQLDFELV